MFDDLALCRTVAETVTPAVVGIGHEADRPLVDEATATIRRQRVLIAALGLLVLGLTAYILYI